MRYPDYKTYNKLYAKYINSANLSKMMDYAGKNYKGKKFLDLCCGDGEATKEALNRGADCCYLVDQEPNMVPKTLQRITKKRFYIPCLISSFLELSYLHSPIKYLKFSNKFDIVFCRQGINYWLNSENIKLLSEIMSQNGIFIFNTFNTCPAKEPVVKEYKIKNISFVEISYLADDDIIHHVQIRENYPPHITEFKWMSKEYFQKCLNKYFNYEIITKNKTDIYKCIKNKEK